MENLMSPRPCIDTAIDLLRGGALVVFPTETVYGLGADATNPLAVRRIFAAKGRPTDHPVIVHLPDAGHLDEWAHAHPLAGPLANKFWPGPLTMVLQRKPQVLNEVTGGRETVGLRVPSHPVAQELLSAFGGGIAAPSANRFGKISATSAAHVRSDFPAGIHLLDGGDCTIGIESTIVDLSNDTPALLRLGAIHQADLETITGPLPMGKTPAPGTLRSHYSPHTALHLSNDPDGDARRFADQGLSVAVLHAAPPAVYAKQLYAKLRQLDQKGVDLLVAEWAEETGMGPAINDRLQRAAAPESED